jgi:aminoglycoside 2'-N-acetyltransferase I
MQIVAYAEAEVPRELRLQVISLQRQAWPPEPGEPPDPAPWHDPALRPRSVLLVEEGRVLAALDILSKDIVHAGESFFASGLSAVVTDRELRGRGYGGKLAAASRKMIEASGADLGIFTCDRHLRMFYERAGWQHLPGTVLIGGTREQPFASDQFDKVTMASFFSARARAVKQAFLGVRIELYSGGIDKLW